MPFGPAAAAIAAPIVGGLVQGAMSGGGASQAAGISQQAMQTGAANYAHDQANSQPFITAGQNALAPMGNLLGLNGQDAANAAMSNFQTSPGYGFAADQGLKAVDHGAAAQGMLRSGETLRAEQTLGNNLANQEFGNYFNRLSGLAGIGLQGVGLGNQSTSAYNSLLGGTSNAAASNAIGAGNTQASIYGNAINGAVGGYKNYQRNLLFSTDINGGGSGGFNSVSPTPTPGASWGI